MADGGQRAREGRAGPCGGQPSVTSYISGGRDGVGLDQGGQRQGSGHSMRFRPKGQGQLRGHWLGEGPAAVFWVGQDQIQLCSHQAESGKLAPSWKNWGREIRAFLLVGTQGQWEQGGEDNTAPGLAQASPGTGGGVKLDCSGLSPCEVPTFGPAGVGGVPIFTLLLWSG